MSRRNHSSSATPGLRQVRVLKRRTPEDEPETGVSALLVRGLGAPLWVRALWGAGFSIIALALFWILRPVFAVLAASTGIAYVLDPVVDWFESRGFSREMGIGFVFTALSIGALFFVLLIVPAFIVQAQQFSQNLAPFFSNLGEEVKPALAWISEKTGTDMKLDASIDRLIADLDKAIPWLQQYAGQIRNLVGGGVQGLLTRGLDIITTLINLALMPIFVFYLLLDWDRLVAAVGKLIPMDMRPRVTRIAIEVDKRLAAFVRGQITVSAAMVVLYSLGLLIVGIDLAIPVGVLSGVLFIVPYLGTAVGVVLASILSVMKFGFSLNLLWTLLVFVVVQSIEGYLLTPRIVGSQVGLHPLVVMIALIVGGSLMGIWGMLLAIPITAVLSVLGWEWLTNYFDSAAFKGSDQAAE
ncbi:MAG: putative PurR-regulated permease PerM [Myxococcota bacterium]|jgi:predicted PurR-regulated permease PerM